MTESDSFVKPTLMKYPLDVQRILLDLIEAGLSKGECSANDIRPIDLKQVNVTGCVFKILRKFGFAYNGRHTYTTAKQKHRREVKVWELAEPLKAQVVVNVLKPLINAAANQQQQLFML